MYGVDFIFNSGNIIYCWNLMLGEMYIEDLSQGMIEEGCIFLIIWDGGGNDIYDMFNYLDNVLIDFVFGGVFCFLYVQFVYR